MPSEKLVWVMTFTVKIRAKTDNLRRIIKYTKNPLNCILAYAFHNKKRIKFRWGFSGDFDWKSIWFILKLAEAEWCLCDHKDLFAFTDGKFSFYVSNFDDVGSLIDKPSPLHCFDYRNAVVLDVGAFTGDSVVLFFKWGARKVIAYEPVPKNVKLMKLNVKVNKLEEKVTVMPYAVSDEKGFAEFSYDDFDNSFGLNPGKFKIKFPSVSFEQVLNRIEDVDIAKVNCEGCEKHLLEVNDLRIHRWVIQVHHAYLLPLLINHFKNRGFDVAVNKESIPPLLQCKKKE